MAAHMRVRAADVSHDQVVLAEMLGEPAGIDHRLQSHSAATISASAAIAGRSSSRASQAVSDGKPSSSTPSMSRARWNQGTYAMSERPYSTTSHSTPFSARTILTRAQYGQRGAS